MIWYLLYPVRGTSNPPLLPSEHPVRRAFYRHGTITARHWLLAMLVAVTIGVVFTYPVIFLSEFSSSGISGLPHHVWTGSSSFESQPDKQPDLEMRQVWLHGAHMQALNKSTLQQALDIQKLVLGETSFFSHANSELPTHLDWGYHSPLMYWNSSETTLEQDDDVLKTINEHTRETSFLNFTLRPMSVFGGKSFTSSRLVAADALILTLFNRENDSAGLTWQNNLERLGASVPSQWTLGNNEDAISQSRVYEYRFQPLSIRQYTALVFAYGMIGLYVAVSLRRLKAFRSRFGLVVTAITQIATSISASFTICGLLKINLAQIPQEAYPFVVLTIGLENIFRLINAVLSYPPEMPPQQRIANGLGDIGHSSLVSAAQNLLLLWLLSLVVSPGVSAFCAFASVALLFDFFFFITFFVAVLNVDIRRLELQDSITRSRSPKHPKRASKRPSWLDALVHGRVPFSTRMAGSVVTITFVLVLNWHLSDHSIAALRSKSWSALTQKQNLPATDFDSTAAPPLNATRNLSSWMRMQDYDNAVHFMSIVKPGGASFTARVFNPLVLVLDQADRTGISIDKNGWLSAVRNLAIHHFYPFALVVVFVVAFVTVLMNFLLWDERAEEAEKENPAIDSGPINVKSIETSHKMDIVRLAQSSGNHILSAGLDRKISIALYDKLLQTYTAVIVSTGDADDAISRVGLHWPVTSCLIDRYMEYMAVICGNGQILHGKLGDGRLSHSIDTLASFAREPPMFADFVTKPLKAGIETCLIAITTEGRLFDFSMSRENDTVHQLRSRPTTITTACASSDHGGNPVVIAMSITGDMYTVRWDVTNKTWDISRKSTEDKQSSLGRDPVVPDTELYAVPDSRLILLSSENEARLLAISRGVAPKLHLSVPLTGALPRSVRLLPSQSAQCTLCGGHGLLRFGIAYTEIGSGDCNILSFAVKDSENEVLCFDTDTESCRGLDTAVKTEHRLTRSGPWEATSVQTIAGIRRPLPSMDVSEKALEGSATESPLRRRRKIRREDNHEEESEWEAYIFSLDGELHTAPLQLSPDSETQLYAVEPGPVARLGPRSVGVSMGNTVHIVKVANENGQSDPNLKRTTSNGSTSWPSRRKPRKSQ